MSSSYNVKYPIQLYDMSCARNLINKYNKHESIDEFETPPLPNKVKFAVPRIARQMIILDGMQRDMKVMEKRIRENYEHKEMHRTALFFRPRTLMNMGTCKSTVEGNDAVCSGASNTNHTLHGLNFEHDICTQNMAQCTLKDGKTFLVPNNGIGMSLCTGVCLSNNINNDRANVHCMEGSLGRLSKTLPSYSPERHNNLWDRYVSGTPHPKDACTVGQVACTHANWNYWVQVPNTEAGKKLCTDNGGTVSTGGIQSLTDQCTWYDQPGTFEPLTDTQLQTHMDNMNSCTWEPSDMSVLDNFKKRLSDDADKIHTYGYIEPDKYGSLVEVVQKMNALESMRPQITDMERRVHIANSVKPVLDHKIQTLQRIVDTRGMGKAHLPPNILNPTLYDE